MIKVMILGRLGKDPEMKTSSSGKTYALISIASDEGKKKDGTKLTTWLNVFVWDKQAELAQTYLQKGSQVYVECSMTTSDKGYALSAREITYLSGIKPKALDAAVNIVQKAQNGPVDASANANHTNMQTNGFVGPMSDFDDIPF